MKASDIALHLTAQQQLKRDYPKIFRMALMWALIIHVAAFLFMPEIKIRPYRLREKQAIEAIEIPDQFKIPPPPKEQVKQQVVTEIAPSDDATAEDTIASTELDVEAPPELPPALQRPDFFVSYDEPPVLVRQVSPKYPDLARQAELEGTVQVLIGINEFGDVVEATIVRSVPGLDQSALDAVYQWKFKPAKQRDVAVPVRIMVPIVFTLRG